MGAEQFYDKATGATAEEAFKTVRDAALYDHGHSGYSGTIAEKSEFTMITEFEKNPMITAEKYADQLIYEHDARVDDKWGPAGCIDNGDGTFLFFGWASA